ncbi:MAG: carboxypeptidase regulatory-like domain-containing protein [Spirochaetes bacterium]|nr:carboxypeptidase regulatory-like domain-containing protein [Spirochaetota bacterium]
MKFKVNMILKYLKNRFVITFLSIGLIIGIWSIYVQYNNDGIIMGKVVDETGKGIPNAVVIIVEELSGGIQEPLTTHTDKKGNFLFKDIDYIEFIISAKKSGYTASEKTRYHLYFKRENFKLPRPLVLNYSP